MSTTACSSMIVAVRLFAALMKHGHVWTRILLSPVLQDARFGGFRDFWGLKKKDERKKLLMD